MKNCITITMKKDYISIKISDDASHDAVVAELNRKIPKLKDLYKDEKNPIRVEGKVLKIKEMEEIKKLITAKIDVKVSFESPEELGLAGIKKVYERDVNENSETKLFRGSLRSGQKIEYEGSIVIIGDVNNGAEVIAVDNIIIVGTLRGLAHAGAKGNKKAIIAADIIDTPQLRIANVVKEIEKGELLAEMRYAHISGDEIVIEE